MGLTVSPIDQKARPFDYYGVRLHVRYQNSAAHLRAKRMELTAEAGMSEEDYDALDDEAKGRLFGRAFIGTIVMGIDPFKYENEDGETVDFRFDAPSSMEEYDTLGEELLGEDRYLREKVLERSVVATHFELKREGEALGKSRPRSDSGTP